MSSTSQADLPYWQVNVPLDKRSAECPDFLVDANDKDKRILATPDLHYHILTWPEVREVISANRIDLFQRVPSELRRYKEYMALLKQNHGSVTDFVMKERLHWTDLTPKAEPFVDPNDVKILFNDWPYGIDKRIVHLVVWTKFGLEEDTETGDLTPDARKAIDNYVEKVFRCRTAPEKIIWFKNWSSLKSLHAIEHFHVMLLDPDRAFLEEITHGDTPMADTFVSSIDRWMT